MLEPACQHWAELSDRRAVGDALAELDQQYLKSHAAKCRACAAEAQVWAELSGWSGERNAAVTVARAPEPLPAPRRRRRLDVAIATAAALVLVAGIVAVIRFQRAPESPLEVARLTSVSGSALVGERAAAASVELGLGAVLTAGSGGACAHIDPGVWLCAAPGSQLRIDDLHLARRRVTLLEGRVAASLETQPAGSGFTIETTNGTVRAVGTVFSVEATADHRTLARVLEGAVAVESHGRTLKLAQGRQADVNSERDEALSPDDVDRDRELLRPTELSDGERGGVLEVSTAADATITVDGVELGSAPVSVMLDAGDHVLELRFGSGATVRETLTLDAGERATRHYTAPTDDAPPKVNERSRPRPVKPAPEATPEKLIERARALRAAGRYLEAARAYRRLQSTHPHSAEAHASLVSLAELELGPLASPHQALRHCELYLQTGGENTEEARYDRVLALRALGSGAAAADGLRDFLRDFPLSPRAAKLRAASADGGGP